MDVPMNASSIRLPKVMAMFASRACRSSIMIGTALHKEEMQKVRIVIVGWRKVVVVRSKTCKSNCAHLVCQIVRNLSGLEQPWNCPHGYVETTHSCTSMDTLASTPITTLTGLACRRPTLRHLLDMRQLEENT